MPNDENKIILEFPATNVEIELGETITFDNISGFLNSDRVTYDGESLTDKITHLENDKADASYVNTELAKKADKTDTYTKTQVDNIANAKLDKANPTGSGSLSLNRKPGDIGNQSVTVGDGNTASGSISFAAGKSTIANHRSQHVFGEFNTPDDSTASSVGRGNYIEIIGNGTGIRARSNARTLDWDGNETLAGNLTFNGNKSLTDEISRIDGRIDNLPNPMIFKGTLGENGTITSLPDASASNAGYTYKVITAGTYAGQEAKVGDTFTSAKPVGASGYSWILFSEGDTDTDTWRNIKVNGTEVLGSGISSGSADFVGSENVDVEFDNNGNKIGIKTKNIYTKAEVNDIVADAIYGVLPSEVASGSVANFKTSLELPIKSLGIDVNAVQEAGTPTPSSPKAISGWNAITLDVNGTTEVINLGGTYYGGHFTQDKAGHRQLVVTNKFVTYIGADNEDWFFSSVSQGNLFRIMASDRKDGYITSTNCICNSYKPVSQAQRTNGTISGTSIMLDFINNDISNLVDWKSNLANNPIEVVYELATPIIIDLPGGEPIVTLNGTNNIFADSGDCAVEYKCSVAEYVANHSGGGGAKSLGGVFLGGSNSGSEEEPTEESEDTEKVKLDETKVEINAIGDDSNIKKLGGE